MLEQIIYRNHLGKEMKLGEAGIYVNSNDLRDFKWEYTTKNNRISSFRKGIVQKTIPLVIKCASDEKAVAAKNSLFEIAEIDVIAKEYGKIIIGDYYLRCYVTESKKSNYLIDNNMMNISLKITTDLPMWIREKKLSFTNAMIASESEDGLDYPHDYPFDYFNSLVNRNLVNDDFSASDFELIIYGSCENPEIVIGSNMYGVDVTLAVGEYLVVNSVTKKIYKVKNNGEKVNMFHFRNRNSDIFEKIPSGSIPVSWHGFGFDITLLQERSEPKWH